MQRTIERMLELERVYRERAERYNANRKFNEHYEIDLFSCDTYENLCRRYTDEELQYFLDTEEVIFGAEAHEFVFI